GTRSGSCLRTGGWRRGAPATSETRQARRGRCAAAGSDAVGSRQDDRRAWPSGVVRDPQVSSLRFVADLPLGCPRSVPRGPDMVDAAVRSTTTAADEIESIDVAEVTGLLMGTWADT